MIRAGLTVVGLSGDGPLAGRVAVLVAPLPVDAAHHPRAGDDVLHHLRAEQAPLAPEVGLGLLDGFACGRGGGGSLQLMDSAVFFRAAASERHVHRDGFAIAMSVRSPSWSSQTAVTVP